MLDEFEDYLIDRSFKQVTPSGRPSTVYDYKKRIERVCKYEGISVDELAKNIPIIIKKYDIDGEMEHIGNKSHRAVINALKRFHEFVDECGIRQ